MHPISIAIQYLCRKNNARFPRKWGKGISICGRKVTNLRYAEDTILIAGTKGDLTELITKVKGASEEAGLYLNVKKTKVTTTGKLDHIIVDDNIMKSLINLSS